MIAFETPITVTKLDYYGKPYEAIVYPRKHFDYGKAWERHKELLEVEVELRKGCNVSSINTKAVNNYHENQLWEDER